MFWDNKKKSANIFDDLNFKSMGDTAVLIEISDEISESINHKVHQITNLIESQNLPFIEEIIPVYASLLVNYDPLKISFDGLIEWLKSIKNQQINQNKDSRTILIPTLYGGEYGPDLDSVAQHNHLTPNEVIDFHSTTKYLIYALGFSPGFPYLAGLPSEIHCPRLTNPRTAVPAGSVGIADSQTGIYSMPTPGGWRLIGKTPLNLFDQDSSSPTIFSPGDYLKFVPLGSQNEYLEIENLVTAKTFSVEVQ